MAKSKFNFQRLFSSIVILTKPPKLIYKDMRMKIGSPKDYDLNVKDAFAGFDK